MKFKLMVWQNPVENNGGKWCASILAFPHAGVVTARSLEELEARAADAIKGHVAAVESPMLQNCSWGRPREVEV